MLTRFELFVIFRNQVADRRLRRRALAVEAAMEELAGVVGADAVLWGLAGLGAGIDAEMAIGNPGRRGAMAAELLATEGAPAEVAAAALARLGPVEGMDAMTAALVAAEVLCEMVWDELEGGAGLDAVDARGVEVRVRRAAEKRGDETALRVVACLQRAGIGLERAAELALAGMRRVREDLKL